MSMDTDLRTILPSLGLNSYEFMGKVAVITGAGSGIGLQTARAFALLGACVVIAEVQENGKHTSATIIEEGGQALFVRTDVSDPASVALLAETVHACFGPVDILVNNAIRCPVAKVVDMGVGAWDQVMAVNLRGTFLVTKAFLPDMLKKKSGVILNMVSADAMPGLSAYIASKQGIIGFSQSLDLEVESANIQVIPFGPGMVDTPGIRGAAPALAPLLGLTEDQFLNTPLHAAYDGLMPPEHAGAAAVYLAARLAKEFHGQVINGYEVLEKAGFLKTSLQTAENAGTNPRAVSGLNSLAAVEKLSAILRETEAELQKLPAFIRPMARAGFKSKSGQSLADWQKTVADLCAEMHAGQVTSRPGLPMLLEKLTTYYRDLPKETARFTKDAEFLQQVSETALERINVIEQLIQSLAS